MERRTLTVEETAVSLGIGRNLAYELARRNELPVRVIRIGKRLLIPAADVEELLAAQLPEEPVA